MENEQVLIDAMFQIAMVSAEYNHGLSNEKIADWVTKQLETLGFHGHAQGMSWFVLDSIDEK